MGFTAETEDLVARARAKLESKRLDLIVANEVEVGFGGETIEAVLVRPQGQPIEVPRTSKRELADLVTNEVLELRSKRRVAEPAETGAGRR